MLLYQIPFPGYNREYWKSYLVTLMKLRLNLGYQDLAYHFGVPISTLSRRFQGMLDIVAIRLDFLSSDQIVKICKKQGHNVFVQHMA